MSPRLLFDRTDVEISFFEETGQEETIQDQWSQARVTIAEMPDEKRTCPLFLKTSLFPNLS